MLDGIKDEPTNTRYHFYLANSYYDTSSYEIASQYYIKRIELGGWIEEKWYSNYKLGLCYYKMNQIEKKCEQ